MKYFHTALSVKNLKTSQEFYETVFQLKFRSQAERKELRVKFVNLEDSAGNIIELFEHSDPLSLGENLMDLQKIGIKHISFIVDNIESVIEKAVHSGAEIIQKPQKGKTVKRYSFISDPDGIPIELVEL